MRILMNMLMLTGAAYFDTSSKVLVSFLFNILHTVPKVVILVQLLNKNYLMLNSILSRCTDYYKKKKTLLDSFYTKMQKQAKRHMNFKRAPLPPPSHLPTHCKGIGIILRVFYRARGCDREFNNIMLKIWERVHATTNLSYTRGKLMDC